MDQFNKLASVLILLIAALLGIALIVFGINHFNIEPGEIVYSQGVVSFGASSKLGWILTFGFFILYLLFSLIRRLYYKITGRG